ncbi:MAG: hypothetical protein WBK67_02915 [Minisyncoccales bacterium]
MKRIMLLATICGMLLMGCGTPIAKIQYVKQTIPALPEKPQYYPVVFDENLKLTEDYARNLLKNKALTEDYVAQLIAIIEGAR